MSRPRNRACFGALLLLTLASLQARADVEFHGFGQAICGTTFSNTHTGQSQNGLRTVTNLRYEADPSCGPESLFALQMDTKLSDHVSLTAQLLDTPGSPVQSDPRFSMAFVTFDFDDNWPEIRVGRQKVPWYMYSANREVGESYVWVRPPAAVYFETPDSFDGIYLSKTILLGHQWTLKPIAGYGGFSTSYSEAASGPYPGADLNYTANKGYGTGFELNYSSVLRLRAAYLSSAITITTSQTDSLFSMMNALGMSNTVNQLAVNHSAATFREVGFEATPGNWVFGGEYVQSVVSNSFVAKSEQYYVSASYRFGNLTTALTWEHNQQAPSFNALNSFPSNAGCLAPGVGLVPGLCAVYVNALLESQVAQDRYYDISLRYDLTPHVALKLDYTAYDSGAFGIAKKSSSNLLAGGVTFYF